LLKNYLSDSILTAFASAGGLILDKKGVDKGFSDSFSFSPTTKI
jgi:hypothetical protein